MALDVIEWRFFFALYVDCIQDQNIASNYIVYMHHIPFLCGSVKIRLIFAECIHILMFALLDVLTEYCECSP